MNKPTKIQPEPYWDYFDVMDYIDEKYGIRNRNYHETYSEDNEDWKSYMDFWHWASDDMFYDVYNGCRRVADILDCLEYEGTPKWIKEILQMIYDEFGEDEMNFWIEW